MDVFHVFLVWMHSPIPWWPCVSWVWMHSPIPWWSCVSWVRMHSPIPWWPRGQVDAYLACHFSTPPLLLQSYPQLKEADFWFSWTKRGVNTTPTDNFNNNNIFLMPISCCRHHRHQKVIKQLHIRCSGIIKRHANYLKAKNQFFDIRKPISWHPKSRHKTKLGRTQPPIIDMLRIISIIHMLRIILKTSLFNCE